MIKYDIAGPSLNETLEFHSRLHWTILNATQSDRSNLFFSLTWDCKSISFFSFSFHLLFGGDFWKATNGVKSDASHSLQYSNIYTACHILITYDLPDFKQLDWLIRVHEFLMDKKLQPRCINHYLTNHESHMLSRW